MPSTPKPKPAPKKGPGKTAVDATGKSAGKARAAKTAEDGPPKRPVKPATEASADSVATVIALAADMPAPVIGAAQTLKMKELVDTVTLHTGGNKPEVKRTLEAALDFLGATLSGGQGFVLPGLGKGKVAKTKTLDGGEVITLKLKRSAEKNPFTPLAEADD